MLKIHPLPFFFYWKISPCRQIFLSHSSLFDTHLFKEFIPSILPCHIIPLWQKAVTKKQRNLKRNSSTAERKRVIHRDTYISVIHSLCISSHLMCVRHSQWWIAVILLSVAYGCFKPSAVRTWKITKRKTDGKPLVRVSGLHSFILSAIGLNTQWDLGPCQVWLLVKDMWHNTAGVMDWDCCFIDLWQSGVMANDWGRRLEMQGSLRSSEAFQHVCFRLLNAIHSRWLTGDVLNSMGGWHMDDIFSWGNFIRSSTFH